MRAHYLQHVAFEGLGSIEAWLQHKGYEITCTRFYQNADLPAPEEIDFLIIMGGPMSVNDEQELPWLIAEKRFVKQVIQAGKPVLGVCLGAQLIANTLGAKVFPNKVKEIGWFPIRAVSSASNSFIFPKEIDVFHWHGETFGLPEEAVRLAESSACLNQAFQIGNKVIGLQFHLETTPESARSIVENCRDELIQREFVQTEAEILAVPAERYTNINKLMNEVLDYLYQQHKD